MLEARPAEEEDEGALEPEGSELLFSGREGFVRYVPPATLECVCETDGLDQAAAWVGGFLGVVSVVVTGLVAAGAARAPMLLVSGTWAALAVAAAVYATRARRGHGRFLLAFDEGAIDHYRGGRLVRRFSMRDVRAFETIPASLEGPEPATGRPRWFVVRLEGGRVLRLGRAPPFRMRRLERLLLDFGAPLSRR